MVNRIMKKLIIAILLFVFCFGFTSFCFGFTSFDAKKAVIARKNAASCSAPAWYNQTGITVTSGTGNVVLAWEANDQGGGVSYAYNNTCTELSGTISASGDIGTYDSQTAFRIDAANDTITWAQTSNQYGDLTADMTVCVEVESVANPDSNTEFFGIVEESPGNDYIEIYRSTSFDSIRGYWGPDDLTVNGGPLTEGSYQIVGYSFQGSQAALNGDHSTNPGDQGTWLDGYETDADELDTAPTDGATKIIVGSWQGTNPGGAGKEIYVRRVALISGWLADCSELTGWVP